MRLPDDEAIQAVLEALSTDEVLRDHYVLKGGNALKYAFQGPRASVDVDMTAVEPQPKQETAETEAVLVDFCRRLDRALAQVAVRYGYLTMLVQSRNVLPPNRAMRTFPALEVKVGYSERSDRQPPFSDTIRLEISLNDIVCDAEYRPVGRGSVHVCSIDDIVAEKLRALLQQVPRNRNRPHDVFDIHFYAMRYPGLLNREQIALFLQRKSSDREGLGRITEEMFLNPEVRERASVGYEAVAERLPEEVSLPPFDEAFGAVLDLVRSLGLPRGV